MLFQSSTRAVKSSIRTAIAISTYCADGGPLANDGYFSGFRLNSLRAVPPVTGRISPAFRTNFHHLRGLEAQIDSSHANDGRLTAAVEKRENTNDMGYWIRSTARCVFQDRLRWYQDLSQVQDRLWLHETKFKIQSLTVTEWVVTRAEFADIQTLRRHAATSQYLDPERRDMVWEVSPSLVRPCGTPCRWMFAIRL